MKAFKSGLILIVVVLTITLFTGCGKPEATETTKPTLGAGEPEYAPAIAEEILMALNLGDYGTYTKYFDENMKKATPEGNFKQIIGFIVGKIGAYKSKVFSQVQIKNGYTIVVYKAKFSDEPKDVTVSISFKETGDKVQIGGLWFDSPKLREQ